MSGAAFLLAKCCCGVDVGWCGGTCNTSNPNGPVKLDCRGVGTFSLNFGLSASLGDLMVRDGTDIAPDPTPDANASFVPKERGGGVCDWEYAYSNLTSEFYLDLPCFTSPPFSPYAYYANRDRWLYNQRVTLGIGEINGDFPEAVAPTLPDGVDRDNPTDQANWRLLIGVGLIEGQYYHSGSPGSPDADFPYPRPNISGSGLCFFAYKHVLVSEICAGNTFTLSNDLDNVPDVEPYNWHAIIEGTTGTMTVSFNPDVPLNTHLATDLSPAYDITFYLCWDDDETSESYTVTVFQNAYPDSRAWSGTSDDGSASLRLFRNGSQVLLNEYAPEDGNETLFAVGAYLNGGAIEVELSSEILVPLDRTVELYYNEGAGYTVKAKVTASGEASPNDPPCPS